MATWIVSGVLVVIVGAIVWRMIKNKREHKGGCSCGCAGCTKQCGCK